MKVGRSSARQVLQPCRLAGYDYQLDPYIDCEHHCHYCYALNEAETDWKEEILIYRDIADQLGRELASVEPQQIYMGWNSDPYHPAEAIYRQTQQVLKLLAQPGFSASILTKSDLVTRDIELLSRMPGLSVGVSLAFGDEDVRRLFEYRAPPNERRIGALRELKKAGIRTYALICPVMPFITDAEYLIEQVAPCADRVWIYALNMERKQDRNWQNVRSILDRHFPELTDQYRQLAFSADHPYWGELRARLKEFQQQTELDLRIEL